MWVWGAVRTAQTPFSCWVPCLGAMAVTLMHHWFKGLGGSAEIIYTIQTRHSKEDVGTRWSTEVLRMRLLCSCFVWREQIRASSSTPEQWVTNFCMLSSPSSCRFILFTLGSQHISLGIPIKSCGMGADVGLNSWYCCRGSCAGVLKSFWSSSVGNFIFYPLSLCFMQ